MPKIYYTPFDNTVNAYTNKIKSLLSAYGDVRRIDRKSFITKILKLNFDDVIIVNWLENMMIDKEGKISLIGCLKLLAIFICFRIMFRKFIYIRHNHYPHSCNVECSGKAKKILDFLEKIPHSTLVHSEVESRGLRKYIPHPLYQVVPIKPSNVNLKKFVIFGNIARYKKIENVIKQFPEGLSLLVIGKCNDEDYLKYLNSLKIDKANIQIISEYISDDKAQEIISSSGGLLITHNDNDMIVSGSFFYAMSIEAKVYALETPFFQWAAKEMGENYVKVFSNLDQMFSNMMKVSSSKITYTMKKPKDLFSDEIIISKFKEILN